MKDVMKGFYKIYFVMFITAMLAFCLDWLDKIELLLSVIYITLCYIFLILCQIKSNLEKRNNDEP